MAAAFVIGLASSGCGADDEESACVEPELLATAWVLGVFLLALVAIVVWEFLLRQRFVDRG